LNKKLVPGQPEDTAQRNKYKRTLRLSRHQQNTIHRFGISSVDNTGYEEFYGPFELGVEYGEASTSEPIDWAFTRQDFETSMHSKGYLKVGSRANGVTGSEAKRESG